MLCEGHDFPPLPIVILTGSTTVDQTRTLFEAGIQDFFTKSMISPEILPRIAQNAVDRHSLMQQLVESEKLAEAARFRADDASRAKSMFLTCMSHELRTPLTAVLGLTELLIDNPASDDAPTMLEMVRKNARYLAELVDQILDVAKIEAGTLEIDCVDCSPLELLNEVCQLLKPRAADEGLTLELDVQGDLPEIVTTDSVRTRQILLNLLTNAIKFTQSGGITVTAMFHDAESLLQVDVADTGDGVSEEIRERIFEPFVQQMSSRKRQGVGLGLPISRSLARRLGGDLVYRVGPNGGSVFSLTLKVGHPHAREVNKEDEVVAPADDSKVESVENAWTDRHLLVVEDTPTNQFLLKKILAPTGARVTVVENGEEALAVTRLAESDGGFDVILMDMQMPIMDGFEAARRLKSRGEKVPIVALTASAMAGDRERCLEAGCDAYIVKPIDRERLLTTIAGCLSPSQGHDRSPRENGEAADGAEESPKL